MTAPEMTREEFLELLERAANTGNDKADQVIAALSKDLRTVMAERDKLREAANIAKAALSESLSEGRDYAHDHPYIRQFESAISSLRAALKENPDA